MEILTPFSGSVREPEEEESVCGPGMENGGLGHRIVIWNLKPKRAVLTGTLFLLRFPLIDPSFKVSHSYQVFPVSPGSPLGRCVRG